MTDPVNVEELDARYKAMLALEDGSWEPWCQAASRSWPAVAAALRERDELRAERDSGCCDHGCILKMAGVAPKGGMATNSAKCYCPSWKLSRAFQIILQREKAALTERDELRAKVARLEAELEIARDVSAFHHVRAEELGAANLSLADEAERLKSGLRWYAHRQHYIGLDDWEDGSDPDCPQWLEPDPDGDNSGAMVEDGECARMILSGITPPWDGDEPKEYEGEPCMVAMRAALTDRAGEEEGKS